MHFFPALSRFAHHATIWHTRWAVSCPNRPPVTVPLPGRTPSTLHGDRRVWRHCPKRMPRVPPRAPHHHASSKRNCARGGSWQSRASAHAGRGDAKGCAPPKAAPTIDAALGHAPAEATTPTVGTCARDALGCRPSRLHARRRAAPPELSAHATEGTSGGGGGGEGGGGEDGAVRTAAARAPAAKAAVAREAEMARETTAVAVALVV
mmetsp:Transcript_12999/g.34597  ORF Transcript_12999/g.34597 Transcript_12999/m.34597 type:complete len:207 (+) Transcript_12999:127-747(+)